MLYYPGSRCCCCCRGWYSFIPPHETRRRNQPNATPIHNSKTHLRKRRKILQTFSWHTNKKLWVLIFCESLSIFFEKRGRGNLGLTYIWSQIVECQGDKFIKTLTHERDIQCACSANLGETKFWRSGSLATDPRSAGEDVCVEHSQRNHCYAGRWPFQAFEPARLTPRLRAAVKSRRVSQCEQLHVERIISFASPRWPDSAIDSGQAIPLNQVRKG